VILGHFISRSGTKSREKPWDPGCYSGGIQGNISPGATNNTVRDAVLGTLASAGFPSSDFSGISMRRGGLTTALAGGVPSSLYELQSGHTSDAWKHYVLPGQTDQLLRFYNAFQL
jgi:hypothetical protein